MDDSPFAKLPPELRNEIWELTVTNESELFLCDRSVDMQPSITLTCKQIRNESLGLFYRCNKFVFNEICCRRHQLKDGCCDASHARLTKLKYWLGKMDHFMLAAMGSIRILLNLRGDGSVRYSIAVSYTEISYKFKRKDFEGNDITPELHAHVRTPEWLLKLGVDLRGYEAVILKTVESFHKDWVACGLEGKLVATFAS